MESCNLGGATVHLSDEVRLRLWLAGLLDKCQGAPATSYRMLPASHKEMAIDTEEYTETECKTGCRLRAKRCWWAKVLISAWTIPCRQHESLPLTDSCTLQGVRSCVPDVIASEQTVRPASLEEQSRNVVLSLLRQWPHGPCLSGWGTCVGKTWRWTCRMTDAGYSLDCGFHTLCEKTHETGDYWRFLGPVGWLW